MKQASFKAGTKKRGSDGRGDSSESTEDDYVSRARRDESEEERSDEADKMKHELIPETW